MTPKESIAHGLDMWSNVTGETTCQEGADVVIAALDAAGYAIIKEDDRFAMQEKAWKYDQLCK